MAPDIAARFLDRSRYYLGVEYPAKIRRAVSAIPPDRLWWRANDESNSVGNLLLHLTGNVRQWIVAGVGGAADARDRESEFAATQGADASALLEQMEKALSEVDTVLARLTPAELADERLIQGRMTSVFGAIYHVVEHFAGHTGQIIVMTKALAPGAIQFYDDAGGLARPIFLGDDRSDIE